MRVVKSVDEMEEVYREDHVGQHNKADRFLSRLSVCFLVNSKVILDVFISASSVKVLRN